MSSDKNITMSNHFNEKLLRFASFLDINKKFIPVGPDLENLLIELGYEDLKGSKLFILEPNRTVKETTMMAALSKGFSHYYKQAFLEEKPMKFKILRKTYLSYIIFYLNFLKKIRIFILWQK